MTTVTTTTIHVQNPWFNYIRDGTKTIEGRTGPAGKFRAGPIALVCGDERYEIEVVEVRHFDDLGSYLGECWRAAAPHARSIEEARALYHEIELEGVKVFGAERVRERGGIEALRFRT